jgi:hypothetical protein
MSVRWQPASKNEVEELLRQEIARLHPLHRERFQSMRVPLRQAPIADSAGESAFIVAELEGQVIYYEDVEEGFELIALNGRGEIPSRGYSQDPLSAVMYRLCGDPSKL